MEKKQGFWDGLIGILIVVAIAQIFLEDFSRIGAWNISVRKLLIIMGFLLDFIFTLEFIIRSIASKKKKGWVNYFMKEKGWVDFVSAVPLLFLNSGPLVAGMYGISIFSLQGLGAANILKITKIMRIARMARMMRMLRVLRVLKIFKTNDEEQAEKRQRQLTKAVTISVVSMILVLIVTPLLKKAYYSTDTLKALTPNYAGMLSDIKGSIKRRNAEKLDFLTKLVAEDENVLYLYNGAMLMVNHLEESSDPRQDVKVRYFFTDRKIIYMPPTYEMCISLRPQEIAAAKINLLITTLIVIQILALMLFYSDPSAVKE